MALPITSCGLRLDDEAVCVAVGARLGLSLCVPHKCNCGAEVDAEARQAMVCKKARHQALNDVVCRAFISAGIPASKEPAGLCTRDGLSLIQRLSILPRD